MIHKSTVGMVKHHAQIHKILGLKLAHLVVHLLFHAAQLLLNHLWNLLAGEPLFVFHFFAPEKSKIIRPYQDHFALNMSFMTPSTLYLYCIHDTYMARSLEKSPLPRYFSRRGFIDHCSGPWAWQPKIPGLQVLPQKWCSKHRSFSFWEGNLMHTRNWNEVKKKLNCTLKHASVLPIASLSVSFTFAHNRRALALEATTCGSLPTLMYRH